VTLAPVEYDDPSPSTDLIPARADTDSWVAVVRDVTLLSQQIADTEFVPRGLRGSIPATAAAILYGREVGLPPMTALSQIAVVDGRPALSAEAMRALVLAAGHEITFDETTSATCRIRGRRLKSTTWTPVEWTIDTARRAGLLRRGSAWESYPRAMLAARATTELCRLVFPDVIHGFRSVEELDAADVAGATPEPPSRRDRATVSRRRKSAAAPDDPEPVATPGGDGPASHAGTEGSAPPPPPRRPSLPGEAEDGGGGLSVPRHRDSHKGRPVEDVDLPPGNVVEQQPPRDEPPPDDAPPVVNRVTLKVIFGQLRRLGLGDDEQGRPDRLALLALLANHADLATANDLTQDEGAQVATILSTFRTRDDLDEFLSTTALAPSTADAVATITDRLPGTEVVEEGES
jgi:hypothetical protein